MKYLFLLLFTSCMTYTDESNDYDFMFTLEDGTYVCDKYNISGFYEDCEHVMTGKKVTKIRLGRNISVINVAEGTI